MMVVVVMVVHGHYGCDRGGGGVMIVIVMGEVRVGKSVVGTL